MVQAWDRLDRQHAADRGGGPRPARRRSLARRRGRRVPPGWTQRFCGAENEARCGRGLVIAFDLLHVEGEDRRKLALEVRRAELASLVAGIDAISFSEAIDAECAVVFAKACELGLEGIVSKRLGGAYWSGRSRNWLKVKNPAFQRK